MILLVTYDLKDTPLRDYTPFYKELQRDGDWWHYLTSTWILSTLRSPNDLVAALRPFMGQNDFILVVEVSERTSPQGWLPNEAWKWINDRLKSSQGFLFPPTLHPSQPAPLGTSIPGLRSSEAGNLADPANLAHISKLLNDIANQQKK